MNILFQDARLELGKLLLKHSYRSGTFTLTSGKTSDFYIDCRCTVLIPEGGFYVGKCFLHLISENSINAQAIAGMTLGADPIITATSMVALMDDIKLPQIIIRKEAKGHGTGNYLEKAATVPDGARTLLMDDVLTTGGTLIKSADRLRSQGFEVKDIFLIVDREEGAREMLLEQGFNVYSIFTRTELLALKK
jgi:orotate phosphoribosyltransferase